MADQTTSDGYADSKGFQTRIEFINETADVSPICTSNDNSEKRPPLSLGLPNKDPVFEVDYIKRKILLPLVKKNNANPSHEAHALIPADSKRHKNVYIWKESKEGESIIELKDCIIKSEDSDVAESETELLKGNANFGTGSPGGKLLIILGDPGNGKSSLLASLSNQFLNERDPQTANDSLLFASLGEMNWCWEDGEMNEGESTPVRYLINHVLNSEQGSMDAEKGLDFEGKYLNASVPSVFILLDGYDEIADAGQRKKAIEMIDHLAGLNGVRRIILTSRPEFELELEQHFQQFSLHLRDFSEKDLTDHLIARWKGDLVSKRGTRIQSDAAENKLETFVKKLVLETLRTFRDENSASLDIPLKCRIMSTCFYGQLEDFLESGESMVNFTAETLEISRLYETFFDVKLDVFLGEETTDEITSNDVTNKQLLKEALLNSLMRLSIFHMMGETSDAQLLCGVNWDDYRTVINVQDEGEIESNYSYSADLRNAMKLGFVYGPSASNRPLSDAIQPRRIKFLHRTLPEYFFALFLAENLSRNKSPLLDNDDPQKASSVLADRFEIINDKILISSDYAGVRWLLDRMLANRVPPAEERCPFAVESREQALKKWPAIGNELFNEHLAHFMISQTADLFGELSSDDRDRVGAYEFFNRGLGALEARKPEPDVGLVGILHGRTDALPSVTLLLTRCVKEYACRPDTPDKKREQLAYCFALASLKWVCGHTSADRNRTKIITSMLHLLDRTSESAPEANNALSKWFFKLTSFLVGNPWPDKSRLEGLALAYGMLQHHAEAPHFQGNVLNITQSMLFARLENGDQSKADDFFLVKLDSFPRFNEETPQLINQLLQGFKLLVNDDRLNNPLFTQLANYFEGKLAQPAVATFNKAPWMLYGAERLAAFRIEFPRNLREIEKHLVHPKALEEIIEALRETSQLPETVPIERLLENAVAYIRQTQDLIFEINCQADIALLTLLKKDPSDNEISKTMKKTKVPAVLMMYWYYLLIDKLVPHLWNDDTKKKQVMLSIFYTDLGRKCLVAFTFADCCCRCIERYDTGLGVHFPIEAGHESERTKKPFRKWFGDMLKLLWDEGKGEIAFIDYLFKGVSTAGKQYRYEECRADPPEIDGGSIMQMSDSLLLQADSYMKAIELAKLPCLLFSDMVNEYIPQQLSPTGLEHLAETLKATPLFITSNVCYTQKNESFEVKKCNKNFWDGVVQKDATALFPCRSKSERVKALQEKLTEKVSLRKGFFGVF